MYINNKIDEKVVNEMLNSDDGANSEENENEKTVSQNEHGENDDQEEDGRKLVELNEPERDDRIIVELRQLMQNIELKLTADQNVLEQSKGEKRTNLEKSDLKMNADETEGVKNNEISWKMTNEALGIYEGQTCARKWIAQMKNISSIYGISGNQMRMLFVSKVKGKVNEWLYENPNRALQSMDELCEQMISMFGNTQSKLEERRNFESRTWQSSEKFGKYLDEKLMLAQNVSLDQEELLDRIIEGIPNEGLRNQARIQCFRDISHIRRAFSEVSLPAKRAVSFEKKTTPMDQTNGKEIRCHNCNARGHFARNCFKPKREPGSCYACGEMGHWNAS
ncbi:E3 ubiquitin-protein ligase BRE1-like [Drosophila ficusphila]|uniref:E3 ubiquitin-protein ligase BRE1-like n=1 Tax=Drosophila ficusphila TaxID=30025 RepID=UPI001C897962|nr:E3 ubiquitin-protein ligase BRE1-like [Drosophila ficusphila]